jgi:hypothetical protein
MRICIVQKKTKSLLESLNDVAHSRDKDLLIESRATHVINSAINLINLIGECYDDEDAHELQRRLLLAIQGRDSVKFTRGIRRIREENRKSQKRA